jgi:hypothetical protein
MLLQIRIHNAGILYYKYLTVPILFAGQEGPRTSNPSRYIRFIYNRVLLECATVSTVKSLLT